MKVNLEKLDGLAHKFSFEIAADKVSKAFEEAYKELQKSVSLKGFRKGKAPISVIRRQYGDRVKDDVLQNLVSESYESALKEHSLDPIGYPSIRIDKFENDENFIFSAEFEIRPQIDLKKYEGLSVEKEIAVIEDSRTQEVLENIQRSNAEMIPIFEDRPAQSGDVAEVAFEGFVDGKPLEGAQSDQHLLELGNKQFIEGFEEGVIGMKVGVTTSLNLSFPAEYHNADVAGKPVVFQVTLKGLKRKSLPEINDDLAKRAGPFESLEALKIQIRKDLEEAEQESIKSGLKDKILKALVAENPVEVPRSLHQRQKELLIEDVKKRMHQQGLSEMDFEEYKTKWDQDFNDSATFIVQSSFLVDAIADKLSLRPSHQDLHAKINEIAKQTGLEEARLNEYYHKPENQSRLSFQLMEEKVVSHLIDKAIIREVPKSAGAE